MTDLQSIIADLTTIANKSDDPFAKTNFEEDNHEAAEDHLFGLLETITYDLRSAINGLEAAESDIATQIEELETEVGVLENQVAELELEIESLEPED